MKIVFWCKEPDGLSMSGSLAGVAYMTAMEFGHKSLVFHSGFGCRGLESAFAEHPDTLLIKEELAYFYDSGIDLVLNRLKFEGLDNTGIREQMLCVKKDYMYCLPGSKKSSRELYEEMFAKKGSEALKLLEEMFEIVFIACGGEPESKLNKLILKEADLLVVLCGQVPAYNRLVIDEIMPLNKKTVFLVSMYDKASKYTVKDIGKELHIKKDCIGVLPYNIGFRDSLTDGSVISFLEKALRGTKQENTYYFVEEVKDVTRKILRKVGLYEEK